MEGQGMKDTELNQPISESHSSSDHLQSDGLAASETVGGANWGQSKQIMSQVTMEGKSETTPLCTSTIDIAGQSVEVRRKRGRPPKRKKLSIVANNVRDLSGPDAVEQKEYSDPVPCTATMAPLPECLAIHNNDYVPDSTDDPLISDPPHNEMSDRHSASDSKPEDGIPVLPKRKRGRPRKTAMAVSKETIVVAGAVDTHKCDAHKDSGLAKPVRRLRSRGEQHPLTPDGTISSDVKIDLQQDQLTPTMPSQNKSKRKRGRPKLADQQIPAQVSTLTVSQEASSMLSSDTGCGEGVETDKQAKENTDREEANVDEKDRHLCPQSGEGPQSTKLMEGALQQRRLRSKVAVGPTSQAIPSQSQHHFTLVSPAGSVEPKQEHPKNIYGSEEWKSQGSVDHPPNTEPGSSDVRSSHRHGLSPQPNAEPGSSDVRASHKHGLPPQPVGIPSNVKAEAIEIELNQFTSISDSNSHTSLQYNSNTTKSERSIRRRSIFGYRRKKRRNVLLQREHLAVANQGQEGITEAEKITDFGDYDKEGNSSGSSIKRRGKTHKLMKCKDCGRTFKFLSQYIIHIRIHTGEKPFECPECGKAFTKNSNLNLHLKTHRKSHTYQKCSYCNIKFSCAEYSAHMEMHLQEQDQGSERAESEKHSRGDDHNNREALYTVKRDGGREKPVCQYCGKIFPFPSALIRHVRVHTGEKPAASEKHRGDDHENSEALHTVRRDGEREKQVCQYCGKIFPFRSALIRHVRVHTGEKPYKCDICGKAFGQAYFLRVHELTHWSVKRYNCTLCGKSFTHYSNAKNHTCIFSEDGIQRKRRKPSLSYTCHICKNTFFQLQEFNSHMKAHTGAKLYRCLLCDKLFGVISEFNAHRSRCHRAKGDPSSVMDDDTVAAIQYTVPQTAYRDSSTKSSHASPQSSQPHCKKGITNPKPFQSTIIPSQNLSRLVSKLNKLDNRSDPRKYLCPSCGRLFRHMGRLRAHMLTHARGQSYTCGCCGKTLENWTKLWHHQRIHRQRHGRFTCPECGQGFRFVEPYKRHMNTHPGFQWIQGRPKKVSLPYQCEQCSTSFKTLDLLFKHQLCHSSIHDVHTDTDCDLSLDDHSSHSNKGMFSPPKNNLITMCHPEPLQNNFCPSSLQMDNPQGAPVLKYPDPVPPEPTLMQVVPFAQHQSPPDSCKTVERPRSTHLYQDKEPRIGENVIGKQIATLKAAKRTVTLNAVKSNECEGSPEGIKCAVCGNTYSIISDLYQHYLQHARGQLQ